MKERVPNRLPEPLICSPSHEGNIIIKLKIIAVATAALMLASGLLSAPTTASAASILCDEHWVGTYKVDIDGDGHKDKVTVSEVGSDWQVKVTTQRKKSSTVSIHKDSNVDLPILAFNSIDPVKGKEIEVDIWDYWGGARQTEFKVLTWRHNKLEFEGAPRSGDFAASKALEWWGVSDNEELLKTGYYTFTSKSKHYVDFFQMSRESRADRWQATFHRSVWKSGKWANSGKRRDVKLSDKQAAKYMPATAIGD